MRTADIDVEITLFLHISIRFIIFSDGYHSSFLIVFIGSKKPRKPHEQRRKWEIILFACTTFAWFTSKDEVTNRLSANADYGVRIVESFAPPANWIPGQEVNKDVYATNTGSIASYVREDVSGVLTITKEEAVETGNGKAVEWKADKDENEGTVTLRAAAAGEKSLTFADFVELSEDEKYLSVEAGSYLAYKPAASNLELGKQVVLYPSENTVTYVYSTTGTQAKTYTASETEFKEAYGNSPDADADVLNGKSVPGGAPSGVKAGQWTKAEAKSDFTPDVEGLYVFRRVVNVDKHAMEDFDYVAYYYKDGKYYKITDLEVTTDDTTESAGFATVDPSNPDTSYLDRAGDNNDKDGQLGYAVGKFVREVTTVYQQPTTYEYDAANNRLIATYGTIGDKATAYQTKSAELDAKTHALTQARAALDRAIRDNEGANSSAANYLDKASQLTNELNDVKARLAAIGDASTAGSLLGKVAAQETNMKTNETPDPADLTALGSDAGKIKNAEKRAENAWNALFGTSTYVSGTSVTGMKGTDDDAPRYTGATAGTYGKYTAPTTSTDNNSLLYKLNDAEDKVEAARSNGESKFEDYVNDLMAIYGPNSGNAKLAAGDTYDDIIRKLTYDDLTASAVTTYNAASGNEFHNINALTYNYIKAKADYNAKLAELNSAIKDYKDNVVRLGKAGTSGTGSKTDIIAGESITYVTSTVTGPVGILGDKSALEAEKTTLQHKQEQLEAAIRSAMTNATNATTTAVAGQTTGSGNAGATLKKAIENYNTASDDYDKAVIAFEKAKKEYDNNQLLKIYINLSDNVVTYGGETNKWQLLNPELDDLYSTNADGVIDYKPDNPSVKDTAVFYYTSILEGGKTSTKLVDSVTLDSAVTQDMYKYFDYDLNVALKSAQVNYAEDNETIKADATPAELNATATLSNNKDINTAITWSNTYTPETATSYTAPAVGAVTSPVTIVAGENVNGTAYTYKILDDGKNYYANSLERGTSFREYDGTAWTDSYITLSDNAAKAP